MLLAVGVMGVFPGTAVAQLYEPNWQQLGGTSIDLGLAGLAGNSVDRVWFSADSQHLFARIESGEVWATSDLGMSWQPAAGFVPEPVTQSTTISGDTILVQDPYRSHVIYALGEHLYQSIDNGGEWMNLTAFGNGSLIGRWQKTLAIAPNNPDLIVVGNSRGIWKSFDAGITWDSLNDTLANFPSTRFRQVQAPYGVQLESSWQERFELIQTAGGLVWHLVESSPPASLQLTAPERTRSSQPEPLLPAGYAVSYRVWRNGNPISGDLTDCGDEAGCDNPGQHTITALAVHDQVWAGTSDGRIWVLRDTESTWLQSWSDPFGESIKSIWVNPEQPLSSLAIAGNKVLQTTNGGSSWLDISSNLPVHQWTSVTGQPEANTVYVGSASGVYYSQVELDQLGPAGSWINITGDLPSSSVQDLAVDPLRGRLYASLPGYGIHWMRVPQAEQALQALSSADLAIRPTAPGSLLTIVGFDAERATAGGIMAPILDSGQGQTQLQLPFTLSGPSIQLLLESSDSQQVLNLPFDHVSPGIFVISGEPLILHAATGTLVDWSHPARSGSSILVMATGLGQVNPPWLAGTPAPQQDPPQPIAPVSARLDNKPVPVLSSHLASGYIGIYVVEVEMPTDTATGNGLLSLSAAGRTSNQVRLFLTQ